MKKVLIFVLILVTLGLIDENLWHSDETVHTTPTSTPNAYYSSYTYNASQTTFSGQNADKTCNICRGTKKCHVCSGKGTFACNSLYCLAGRCTSCQGTGYYDHGSYASRCLVCSGDGVCDICKGTNRYNCSICHGNGRCTHCR